MQAKLENHNNLKLIPLPGPGLLASVVGTDVCH